jgi:hypothetical protein
MPHTSDYGGLANRRKRGRPAPKVPITGGYVGGLGKLPLPNPAGGGAAGMRPKVARKPKLKLKAPMGNAAYGKARG